MMRLDGIHHITGITGDGQRCLDFYAGILGLAFVGREQDFEAPDLHLIRLGDQPGRPGGVLSFIEAPGIGRGRAGHGMVHLLSWSVRVPGALEYWADRLTDAGIDVWSTEGGRLRFADPEGLEHELAVDPSAGRGLALGSSAVPAELAIVSVAGVRAYGRDSVQSADILAGRLGFEAIGNDSYRVGTERGGSGYAFDPAPTERGRVGTGTVHHVGWACDGALPAWRQRVIGMGCRVTPVIDRGQCRSIYFREPSGVLFEIATHGQNPRDRAFEIPRDGQMRLSPNVDPRVRPAPVG